ncbi:MAG: DUF4334 domain-containing protein [bacterium]|nr:DUF4334 domain-containing protein [bacterium]
MKDKKKAATKKKTASAPRKTGAGASSRASRGGSKASAAAQVVLERGSATRDEALALFDSLPPIADLAFMFGRWTGSGIDSDHPMDGLLENYAWYGKEFISEDHVHPLLFQSGGGKIFRVNPALMPMGMALKFPFLKRGFMRGVFRLGRPILQTSKTGARLRLISHRGKVSATMAYDALPIHDVFRRIDENTVMGLMDYKGMQDPFFFVLNRVDG